jgi:hypothetical protein
MKAILMMLWVGTAMGFSLRGDQGKGKRSIGKLYIENNLGLNYERRSWYLWTTLIIKTKIVFIYSFCIP